MEESQAVSMQSKLSVIPSINGALQNNMMELLRQHTMMELGSYEGSSKAPEHEAGAESEVVPCREIERWAKRIRSENLLERRCTEVDLQRSAAAIFLRHFDLPNCR